MRTTEFIDPDSIPVADHADGWHIRTGVRQVRDPQGYADGDSYTVTSAYMVSAMNPTIPHAPHSIRLPADPGDEQIDAAVATMRRRVVALDCRLLLAPYRLAVEAAAEAADQASTYTGDRLRGELADMVRRLRERQTDILVHLWRCGIGLADELADAIGEKPATAARWCVALPTAMCAHLAGWTNSAWRAAVSRGAAPAADDRIGREPVWTVATMLAWLDARPA